MAIPMVVNDFGLLETWRNRNLLDKWFFNGVIGLGTPPSHAERLVVQRPMLQTGRERVATALNEAFPRVHKALGYAPVPCWIKQRITTPFNVDLENYQITLASGYVQAIGQRSLTDENLSLAIAYTSVGGMVDDTGTVTVPGTGDPDKLELFYRVSDGSPSSGHPYYRINPVKVTVSGGNRVATVHRSDLVTLTLLNRPYKGVDLIEPNYANTGNTGDFLTNVTTYTVVPDDTNAVVIHYRDGTTTGTVTASAAIVDPVHGVIEIYDVDDYPGRVEYVEIHFKAGYPLRTDYTPEPAMAEAVARIANVMIYRDLLLAGSATVYHQDMEQMDEKPLDDYPLGSLYGEVEAWLSIKPRRLKCKRNTNQWEYVY